jgi:hypothetical protein
VPSPYLREARLNELADDVFNPLFGFVFYKTPVLIFYSASAESY